MAGQTSKERLRAQARALRDRLHLEKGDITKELLAGINDLLPPPDGCVIAGYAAINSELNPMAVLKALVEQGYVGALPTVTGPGEPLLFRRWQPNDRLARGAFAVPAPPSDAPVVRPDYVLVPLLAFDRRGMRLGYGGGYYDRTLAALRSQAPLVAVGLAYAEQEQIKLPAEAHDQPLDAIVTEKEVIIIREDAP